MKLLQYYLNVVHINILASSEVKKNVSLCLFLCAEQISDDKSSPPPRFFYISLKWPVSDEDMSYGG